MLKIRMEGPAGEAGELFGILRKSKGWIIEDASFKPEEAKQAGDVVVSITMDTNRDACTLSPEQAASAGIDIP